jgi:hypothetical protein
MPSFSRDVFNSLTVPGSRLPWLRTWLLDEVWSSERYASMTPTDFLDRGERDVNEIEEILGSAAPRVYDELLGNNIPHRRDVRAFLQERRPCAVVIFDGLSLREIPLLLKFAEKSRFSVRELDYSFSPVPSETLDFVDQRLGFGKTAPSRLPGRTELKAQNIAAYYYDSASRSHRLDSDADALLLWSSFPDHTYSDSGARFVQHFAQIHTFLETAWMNTVQRIPTDRDVLITSDHGYAYFGPGMSFQRTASAVRPLTTYLGGERFRYYSEPDGPPDHSDLTVLRDRHLAIIRGRVQTHPPGAASSRLYKHGGLSLMEMLIPWIELRT